MLCLAFHWNIIVLTPKQTENEACPVILVGGGSILVDRNTQLRGVSTIECPSEHFVSGQKSVL